MKLTRPMSRFERMIQKLNARIHNRLAEVDLQTLADIALWSVCVLAFMWLWIFKGVIR